jgi:hypothetical protein
MYYVCMYVCIFIRVLIKICVIQRYKHVGNKKKISNLKVAYFTQR